jgi:porphobilinogen synthase
MPAVRLSTKAFILPYFVVGGRDKREVMKNFPGVFRFSVDRLIKEADACLKLGLDKILLFGVPGKKDGLGSTAYEKNSIVAQAVREIKKEFPGIVVMTDVCLCAYTTHGHCGVLKSDYRIDNGRTLEALAKMALRHADAGADWVAPSAMAKKQVAAIRAALDKNGFEKTKILGYSAKFASNFYGPFRQAADSAPAFGDRSGYQLDCGDTKAALNEIGADIKEGADMAMVKPALSYLDIVRLAKQEFGFPLAAYNVSGEYAFVKYGAKTGLWDEKKMVFEVLTSIKRAGADLIITYHAKDIARWLKG